MKRILSLIFCVVLMLSFTACDKKTDSKGSGVDIEYYAKLGQIDDVDYKLGDDVDQTQEALSAKFNSIDAEDETHDHSEEGQAFYYDHESGDYTVMTDGRVSCCYITDDKKSGLTHVIKYGGAYGFVEGAVSTQVRDTMSSIGYDTTERAAKDGELFFLPASADVTVLEYEIKDNTILFVFTEHALTAVVIY